MKRTGSESHFRHSKRPSTEKIPSPTPSPAATIDHSSFPHIIDLILECEPTTCLANPDAPYSSLLRLRMTSKDFCDRADALIARHIVVTRHGVHMPGGRPARLPLVHPVRILDFATSFSIPTWIRQLYRVDMIRDIDATDVCDLDVPNCKTFVCAPRLGVYDWYPRCEKLVVNLYYVNGEFRAPKINHHVGSETQVVLLFTAMEVPDAERWFEGRAVPQGGLIARLLRWILYAPDTRFVLVNADRWLRKEAEDACIGVTRAAYLALMERNARKAEWAEKDVRRIGDAISIVSLEEYRARVGSETFRLETMEGVNVLGVGQWGLPL